MAVGKRYYGHGGSSVAMRSTIMGLSYMLGDHHGTADASVNAANPVRHPPPQRPVTWIRQSYEARTDQPMRCAAVPTMAVLTSSTASFLPKSSAKP
ncbi:MAG: hypothetical protein ABIQ18_40010 [Umezawaea sp.]